MTNEDVCSVPKCMVYDVVRCALRGGERTVIYTGTSCSLAQLIRAHQQAAEDDWLSSESRLGRRPPVVHYVIEEREEEHEEREERMRLRRNAIEQFGLNPWGCRNMTAPLRSSAYDGRAGD